MVCNTGLFCQVLPIRCCDLGRKMVMGHVSYERCARSTTNEYESETGLGSVNVSKLCYSVTLSVFVFPLIFDLIV